MGQVFWEQIRNELPDAGEFLTGSFGVSGSFTTTGSLAIELNGIDEVFKVNVGGSEKLKVSSSGDIELGGDLLVPQYIKHKGDVNTFINFTDNRIRFKAGDIGFFDMEKDSDAPYPATINPGGNRINFRVVDRNTDLLLKTDSELLKVNLYHAGNQKLETATGGVNITGNITASRDIETGRVMNLVSQSSTPTAVQGGMFYSASNDFFFGFY
jgi:hypothetical protein